MLEKKGVIKITPLLWSKTVPDFVNQVNFEDQVAICSPRFQETLLEPPGCPVLALLVGGLFTFLSLFTDLTSTSCSLFSTFIGSPLNSLLKLLWILPWLQITQLYECFSDFNSDLGIIIACCAHTQIEQITPSIFSQCSLSLEFPYFYYWLTSHSTWT